jgi:hypothetical protein
MRGHAGLGFKIADFLGIYIAQGGAARQLSPNGPSMARALSVRPHMMVNLNYIALVDESCLSRSIHGQLRVYTKLKP